MRKLAIVVLLAGALGVSAQETVLRPRTVADFFRDFTAEWIRSNPNQAASTRYFSGAYFADLVTWYHLAWCGESVRRAGFEYFKLEPHGAQWQKVREDFSFALSLGKLESADVRLYVVQPAG